MKTLKLAFISSLIFTSTAFAKPLPQTDLTKVYESGKADSVMGEPFNLKPGIYKVGDENSKLNGTQFLMIDKYINDDSQVLAILVSQSAIQGQPSAKGRFYVGKKIANGTSLMLSPIFVDVNGDLSIESELNEKAAVIEITLRNNSEQYRYPYMLQGHNGALDGKLLGMRKSPEDEVKFTNWPAKNVFEGRCSQSALVVSGSTVNLNSDYKKQQRFQLLPINGSGGKFAAMVHTELNTMGEYMTSDSDISKLAFFIQNGSGEENFIVASPTLSVGEYIFNFFTPQRRSFLDIFFPGER
ncbi:MAG TPA: hypothetical protein VN132_16455 [Bdellovibrio sp.]|nr:hypothetical protein [Bdellovibrio sp.]